MHSTWILFLAWQELLRSPGPVAARRRSLCRSQPGDEIAEGVWEAKASLAQLQQLTRGRGRHLVRRGTGQTESCSRAS